jgi:polysaccharide biosynthesis protein PslH
VALELVGASPPPAVAALAGPQVVVTGRVPSVRAHLDAADLVVCPLRFGGGVKVKVLEALAAGRAIVGTPVSAQGLGAAAEALTLGRDARELAANVVRLLSDPAACARMEHAARTAAARLPGWDRAAAELASCWEAAARQSVVAA